MSRKPDPHTVFLTTIRDRYGCDVNSGVVGTTRFNKVKMRAGWFTLECGCHGFLYGAPKDVPSDVNML